jgi:hypothetical protein
MAGRWRSSWPTGCGRRLAAARHLAGWGSVAYALRAAGLLLDGLARCHDGPPAHHGVALGYAAPPSSATLTAVLPPLTALLTRKPDGGLRPE